MPKKSTQFLVFTLVFLLLVSACTPLQNNQPFPPSTETSAATEEPPTAEPLPTQTAQPTAQPQSPTKEGMNKEIYLVSNVLREKLPQTGDSDLDALVAGNTDFALNLYRILSQSAEGNLFYSPYSISLALAMTYAGARGETEQQIAKTLHFGLDQSRLHPAFNALDLMLQTPASDEEGTFRLNIANSLWGQRDYPFRQDFLDTLARNYGAGMYIVDYNQPEQVRALINDWVAEKTEDKIQDLIPQGALTPLTRLVLANAIYFKAAWQSQFDPKATRPDDFTLLDGSVIQTPMMNQSINLPYAKGEDYEAVEIPYNNSPISMFIILPDEGKFDLIEKSLSASLIQQIENSLQNNQVELSLPKFKIESSFDLAEVLAAMGMSDAFNPDKADFTGMVDMPELFISDVVHKAYVDVNEEGTEAAAATAVIMKITSAPAESVTFKVDRPFIFMIMDRSSGTVLFMGRVTHPGAK